MWARLVVERCINTQTSRSSGARRRGSSRATTRRARPWTCLVRVVQPVRGFSVAVQNLGDALGSLEKSLHRGNITGRPHIDMRDLVIAYGKGS